MLYVKRNSQEKLERYYKSQISQTGFQLTERGIHKKGNANLQFVKALLSGIAVKVPDLFCLAMRHQVA